MLSGTKMGPLMRSKFWLYTMWAVILCYLRQSMLSGMKMGPLMGSEFWLGSANGSPGMGIMQS